MSRRASLFATLALLGCGVDVDAVVARATGDATADGAVDAGADAAFDAGPLDAAVVAASTVVAGQSHACALRGGVLACWGRNVRGALGTGDATTRLVPTVVPGSWTAVALLEDATCAIDAAQDLHCFGANDRGQLGLGDTKDRLVPTRVPLATKVLSLGVGYQSTYVVLTDGSMWGFGANVEGQLGLGDTYPGAPSLVPVRIGEGFGHVQGGQGHACAVKASGELYCWGRNTNGELGQPAGAPIQLRAPTRVGTDADWLDLDLGQDGSCGRKRDRRLHCFGDAGFGQLGAGVPPVQYGPRPIDGPVRSASLDTFHACFVRDTGQLLCSGRNEEGQLGLGDTTSRAAFTPTGLPAVRVVSVGRMFTCALDEAGAVHCTGENADGQLGTGDRDRRRAFVRVW